MLVAILQGLEVVALGSAGDRWLRLGALAPQNHVVARVVREALSRPAEEQTVHVSIDEVLHRLRLTTLSGGFLAVSVEPMVLGVVPGSSDPPVDTAHELNNRLVPLMNNLSFVREEVVALSADQAELGELLEPLADMQASVDHLQRLGEALTARHPSAGGDVPVVELGALVERAAVAVVGPNRCRAEGRAQGIVYQPQRVLYAMQQWISEHLVGEHDPSVVLELTDPGTVRLVGHVPSTSADLMRVARWAGVRLVTEATSPPTLVAPVSAPPRAASSLPRTLFLVEDQREVAVALRRDLQRRGALVRWFPTAAEALEVLSTEPAPELILCDLSMPGMDGLAFLQQLAPELRERTMLMTGGVLSDASRALLAGLPDVPILRKPFRWADLVAKWRALP